VRRRDLLRLCATAPAALATCRVNSQPAPPITRAAVVIGVDQPRGLPKLHAAAYGAKMVGDWLTGERFDVKLLTDQVGPVKVADIFNAIADFVERGTVEELVIYFAGHGSVVGYGEFWMLSESPHNPNEAVFFPETFDLARLCGIPNVIFISDACRSTGESLGAQHMRGQLIFPNENNTHVATKIDRFLATALGSPAYEVKDTAGAYNGIYTTCFLAAYQDPYFDTVKEVGGVLVVPDQSMELYLSKIVPQRASAASSKINQTPSSVVESKLEVYIGRAAKTPSPSRVLETVVAVPTLNHVVNIELKDFGIAIIPAPSLVAEEFKQDLKRIEETTGFAASRNLILDSRGPNVFRQATGINIFGTRIRTAIASAYMKTLIVGQGDGALEPTVIQIDPSEDRQGSVVIEFEDGAGTVLAALPRYVANVVVDQGKVANVSYVPGEIGEIGEQPNRTPSYFPLMDELHALVATSAKFGAFQIDGPPEIRAHNAQSLGDALRRGKLVDPTLGIYAAYAYADAGLSEDVRSVYWHMKEFEIDLFDVAMLAGVLGDRRGRPPAPFCPMLSQGWGLLRSRNLALPEELANARDHLLRALWTTFDPEGMRIVWAQLDKIRFWFPNLQ
jgi:hypothetical protein